MTRSAMILSMADALAVPALVGGETPERGILPDPLERGVKAAEPK